MTRRRRRHRSLRKLIDVETIKYQFAEHQGKQEKDKKATKTGRKEKKQKISSRNRNTNRHEAIKRQGAYK
jgi:hypothetical protein